MALFFMVAVGTLLAMAHLRCGASGHRDVFARTFVSLFALIALVTEGLSVATAVSFPVVLLVWGMLTLVLWLSLRPHTFPIHIRRFLPPLAPGEKLLVVILVVVTLMLFAIAVTAPPTTYDAQSYHLPRVCHWIRQRSVAFFSTVNTRQNYMQPLAEYAILHLRILCGSDRLANLVQWTGYIASLCLVSLLAREIGLSRRGQLLATAFAATIPMVVLQATSCQTDLIAASFCLAVAYGVMRLSTSDESRDAWLCGLALGVALLCKGTSYIFCLPLLAGFGLRYLLVFGCRGWRHVIVRWAPVILLAMALNAGFWARNTGMYGTPLGNAPSVTANPSISWTVVSDNIIRNTASHLGSPLPAWNAAVSALVNHVTGPTATLSNYPFQVGFSLFEDDTGNLPHLVLAIFCLTALPFLVRPQQQLARLLAGSAVGCGLLLSALLLWQPWGTRFHTFLFLLIAPLCAWVLDARPRLALLVGLALALYALPFIFLNVSRPVMSLSMVRRLAPVELRDFLRYRRSVFLTPRMDQYFGRDVTQRSEYEHAMRWLPRNPYTPVGLISGDNDLEYRLWVVAERELGGSLPSFVNLSSDRPSMRVATTPQIVFDITRSERRERPRADSQLLFTSPNIAVWQQVRTP